MTKKAVPIRLRDGHSAIVIADPRALLEWYDQHVTYGPTYYGSPGFPDAQRVTLDHLGFAVLFVGRPGPKAAKSLIDSPVDISAVPQSPLADLDGTGQEKVVDALCALMELPGFGAAVASKVLHKLRPATVPVIDNQAIFATYLREDWFPGNPWPTRSVTTTKRSSVSQALRAIARDVSNPDNAEGWSVLEAENRELTRIEIFDKIWWAAARSGGLETERASV